MFRRIAVLIVAVIFLMASTAFCMTRTEKSGSRAGTGMAGKVTAINGTTITVRDARGIERQFELNSAAGLKIGQNAWCEEDCGKGMKIGDKNVQVKSVR